MTNKLVVVINRLKYQKLRKFTIWNKISCTKLQLPPEPLTRGLLTPDLRSLCPVLNWICWTPPPQKKFLGTPLVPTSNAQYQNVRGILGHTGAYLCVLILYFLYCKLLCGILVHTGTLQIIAVCLVRLNIANSRM